MLLPQHRLVCCVSVLHSGADLFDEDANLCADRNMESNEGLFRQLRVDSNDVALHGIACDDFVKHRMTQPVKASSLDCSKAGLDMHMLYMTLQVSTML